MANGGAPPRSQGHSQKVVHFRKPGVTLYNIHTYNILPIYIYVTFNKFIDKFITYAKHLVTPNLHLQLHASIFLYIS